MNKILKGYYSAGSIFERASYCKMPNTRDEKDTERSVLEICVYNRTNEKKGIWTRLKEKIYTN